MGAAEKIDISGKDAVNDGISNQRTALYRHYDGGGALLYVGISLSVVARLAQHRDSSRWYDRIAKVTVEWFDNRRDALRAEGNAILIEKPEFNIQKPNLKIETSLGDGSISELFLRTVKFNVTYSLKDAGVCLGIGQASVKKLIDDGEIVAIDVSGKRRITGWALIEYLEHRESEARSMLASREAI